MTNFIFKSQGTYKKLCQQLELVLAEQRQQRQDLQIIGANIRKLIVNKDLQKQVDEYFDEDMHTDIPEKVPDPADLD